MKARVIAWLLLAAFVFAGYRGWQAFKNPWAVPSITSVMPQVVPCAENCK